MLLRPALLVLALAASSLVWGQALDLTPRFARLSYVEGPVTFQGAGEPSPSALPDRPLEPGDRLSTGRDGRAELAFGNADTRFDQDTELTLVQLTATAVRMQLTAGTASLHLRELFDNETFEIVTPNATLALQEPGEYRVDVAADGATEFTVRTGAADVASAGGPVRVADGQRVRIEGRDAVASLAAPRPADAFDDWVLERELQFAQAEPPASEQPGGNYYEDEALDRYGEWVEEPDYGRVWMPSYAYGGYDPFRYGRWERAGYGWGWYSSMPWSAHTYRHGRWAYLDHRNRWCWVPERRHHRRHVAQETHPYRQPARDDRRDSDRHDRPRDATPRRDDDERPQVASSASLPLRIDADRKPAFGRAAATGKPARGSTIAPSTNRNPSPASQSAPAPQTSAPTTQGGVTTKLRPAKPAEAQSAPVSPPTTRAKGTFARSQEP